MGPSYVHNFNLGLPFTEEQQLLNCFHGETGLGPFNCTVPLGFSSFGSSMPDLSFPFWISMSNSPSFSLHFHLFQLYVCTLHTYILLSLALSGLLVVYTGASLVDLAFSNRPIMNTGTWLVNLALYLVCMYTMYLSETFRRYRYQKVMTIPWCSELCRPRVSAV